MVKKGVGRRENAVAAAAIAREKVIHPTVEIIVDTNVVDTKIGTGMRDTGIDLVVKDTVIGGTRIVVGDPAKREMSRTAGTILMHHLRIMIMIGSGIQ